MFQHVGACGNPSVFQEFRNAQNVLLAVPLLFFLHRHDNVTPSWFRVLESHVLRAQWQWFEKVVFTIFSILTILVFGCFTEAAFLFASFLYNDNFFIFFHVLFLLLFLFVGSSKSDFFWASITLRFLSTFLFKFKFSARLGGEGGGGDGPAVTAFGQT